MTHSAPSTLDRPDSVPDDGAPPARPPVTRRTVLAGVAGSLTLAACADLGIDPDMMGGASAGSEPAGGSTPGESSGDAPAGGGPAAPAPKPGVPVVSVLDDDEALHLLRRATFGPTAALVAKVNESGVNEWLAQQLSPDSIDDGACNEALSRYRMLDKSAQQIKDTDRDNGGEQQADKDLVEAAVVRAVCTERQLFEVMVEFWSNYFNIHTPSDDRWGRRTVSDREVYRPHALGRFADMLVSSAKDPAMLAYLNNEDSCFKDDPKTVQENYGRELLELHTVGVDGGYTEEDVKNSAYILTGWTVDKSKQFRYDAGCHFVGPVQVLDFSDPNGSADGGLAVGEAYLDYLAHHPATATYLCTRLARRFVSDEPSEALVASLAKVFADSDTEIVPVLQALFASDEFRSSVGQKTRRPLTDIVASARALGITVRPKPRKDKTRTLLDVAYDFGQGPLNHGPPDGYSDVATTWLSSARLLSSWNYHCDLVDGRYDDWLTAADEALGALVADDAATVGALADAVAERLLWQPVAPEIRAAIVDYTGKAADDPVGDDRADLVKRIALAVLNSPHHLQR